MPISSCKILCLLGGQVPMTDCMAGLYLPLSTPNAHSILLPLVFAYLFHFGKSGFSATFSRQIRISGFYPDFYVQAPYTHIHI